MKFVKSLSTKTWVRRGLALVSIGMLLGAGIIVLNPSSPGHIARRTEALPRYGISPGSNILALNAEQMDARLTGIEQLGAKWVRIDFDWSKIQPISASEYDWQRYDTIIGLARKHNLEVLGILEFTPEWARPSTCKDAPQCAPEDPAQFGAFAHAVSTRYKDQGLHYWEIWNEPNTKTFFQPTPNTAAYTAILKAAYRNLHRADIQAIVLTGGTAPAATSATNGTIAPTDFLSELYSNDAHGFFDAVAAHPYTYPISPKFQADHAWAQLSTTRMNLRQIMTSHRDGSKKIWLTEFGAPTGGPGPIATIEAPLLDEHPNHVDQTLQAAIFVEALELYKRADWAGPLMIYSDIDASTDESSNESFFGLSAADGTHKPAYDAVSRVFRAN